MGDLSGKFVVIAPETGADAFGCLSAGAVVVVAGPDAEAVGSAVSALSGAGRVAGYVGGTEDAALAELVAELFPGCERA